MSDSPPPRTRDDVIAELQQVRTELREADLRRREAELIDELSTLDSDVRHHRFASWNDVRLAMDRAGVESPVVDTPIVRRDVGHAAPPPPASRRVVAPEVAAEGPEPAIAEPPAAPEVDPTPTIDDFRLRIDPDAPAPRRRRSPLALVASAGLHLLALVVLTSVTIEVARPRDQIAMTASAASGEPESAMQTFEIESVEPVETPEPTEPIEDIAEALDAELSPVGRLAAAKLDVATPVSGSMKSSLESMTSIESLSELSSDQPAVEFCGIAGGGNHFVYLVDSSGSMRDAFDLARRELLRSIGLLKPDQRFYVVFFDQEPDYMQLTRAGRDEPRSVKATPENKEALRRWAMRVQQNRGLAPYDPLKFALELKPDVIFLLSDGEFPEAIAEILRERNRVTNLFDEDRPASIVHTIAYHSEEGESRMKAIAKENGGQYRYVPPPPDRRR